MPAGPSTSSKVLSNATHIIESDYSDATCGKALRTSASPRAKCTNQADEPGNTGKCGFTGPGSNSSCWQDLTVVEKPPQPTAKQAHRRWLCDKTCTHCNFNESFNVGECVTTSSPLGPPTAMKKVTCLSGNPYGFAAQIETYDNQADAKTCLGKPKQPVQIASLGDCTEGEFGTYEVYDACPL